MTKSQRAKMQKSNEAFLKLYRKGMTPEQILKQREEFEEQSRHIRVLSVEHLANLLEIGERDFKIQLQGCWSSKELMNPNYHKKTNKFLGCECFHSISGTLEYLTVKRMLEYFPIKQGTFWCRTEHPESRKMVIQGAR